ncbi:O-antigen ligase [Ramlibacter sp.]|uniref:O-antigen ligase family protein n=1 Tax=Ramlibacter sp. TaxID=1917967 RepID=UPI002611517E|nr:O-antigen ligase family protein [Ramlibacter sp.]
MGPVAFSALLLLMVAAPLMRGGNRNIALIVIEGCALVFLAALVASSRSPARPSLRGALVALLALAPAWLAAIHLLPLPPEVWAGIPGRADYAGLLANAGIPTDRWRPVSLVPDATTVSLLAGIPLVAAFGAGYLVHLRQLRLVMVVFVCLAFGEIGFGMLQLAGGVGSSLHFGNDWGSSRVSGTFANPNHFANYVGMALAAYVWLAWLKLMEQRRYPSRFAEEHLAGGRMLAVWGAGAVLMLVGILMSRSRGAALGLVPTALVAIALVLTLGSGAQRSRRPWLVVGAVLAASIALVGFDAVATRFDLERMAGDAPLRIVQAVTTMEGAAHFWPFGAGWGTYYEVYPRFQPPSLVGTADYAHQDYAQMLFEGGVFAVLLMTVFAWLALTRAVELVRIALRERRLPRHAMAAALCGLGLLGFLLHSLVEFNMHIPANAIAAALLAGAYLRPLPKQDRKEGPSDD